MALKLSLLGKFETVLDQTPVTRFRGDKVRALLAYLAIEGNRPHRREQLATLLWSEVPDKTARQSLSVAYFRLRQALDKQAGFAVSEQLFNHNRQTIEASVGEQFWCDAIYFSKLVAMPDSHTHASLASCSHCLEQLTTAVSLYEGELLPGFHIEEADPFTEWLYQTREQLHRHMLNALTQICDIYLAQQAWTQVQTYAQKLLGFEAWNEKAHVFMMQALAHAGQRGAALAQYDKCSQILWDELGVEPSDEVTAVYEQIKNGGLTAPQPPPAAAAVPKRTLPSSNISLPLTPFFDREHEREQLRAHFLNPAHRLITLVGEGGMGKTRLAQEMAHAVRENFPDGVWFVALANIEANHQPGEQIASAIAKTLQLTLMGNGHIQQQLIAALQNRHLLLILDNFEHILDGADFVYNLLQQSPQITICCTTREPIGFMAETVVPLHGLPMPEQSETDETASPAPSLALFADRAERTVGQFTLTNEHHADVTYICRFVNGSPLGIELAASALRYHSLPQITTSLKTSLDFLTTRRRDLPARHRSMRAVFAYSWDLLMAIEQKLFAQLSVFRGSFTSVAAMAVTDASAFHLEALAEKSLLQVERNGRFIMHTLLRQFAKEKLEDLDEAEQTAVQQRHSQHFLTLLAEQAQPLQGQTPQSAVALIEQDLGNIRAAWKTAVRHNNTDLVNSCVAPLADFCQLRGYFHEAEQTFSQAYIHFANQNSLAAQQITLDNLALRQAQMLIRRGKYETAAGLANTLTQSEQPTGQAHLLFAEALWRQGQYDQAQHEAGVALALAQTNKEAFLEAYCWHHLGIIADYQGHYDTAKSYLETALTQWQKLQARQREGVTLNSLGGVAYHMNDLAQAETIFQKSLEISRQIKDRAQEAWTLNNLGVLATGQGTYHDAAVYLRQALVLTEQMGDQGVAATVHRNFGWLGYVEGDYTNAQIHLELALQICQQLGEQQGEAITLKILGEVAGKQNEFATANLYYRQALTHFEQLGNQVELGNMHLLLAELKRATNKASQAEKHLQDAITLAKMLNDTPLYERAVALKS